MSPWVKGSGIAPGAPPHRPVGRTSSLGPSHENEIHLIPFSGISNASSKRNCRVNPHEMRPMNLLSEPSGQFTLNHSLQHCTDILYPCRRYEKTAALLPVRRCQPWNAQPELTGTRCGLRNCDEGPPSSNSRRFSFCLPRCATARHTLKYVWTVHISLPALHRCLFSACRGPSLR